MCSRPTNELGNRVYLNDPPTIKVGQPFTFYGVANDIGNAPSPSRPEELIGSLHSLNDATLWLGLPHVDDNDLGVAIQWLGDFNGDRLADLAVGMPAAEEQKGRLSVLYGRAGDWPAPEDLELLSDSPSSFTGVDGDALVGANFTAVGDTNGDGYDDLLVAVPDSKSVYLVFGQPEVLGRDLILDGVNADAWVMLSSTNDYRFGDEVGAAGDINGDGLMDFMVEGYQRVFVVLGQRTWPDQVALNRYAAAIIEDTGVLDTKLAAAGDMNGDNYDDFVLSHGYTVYLYQGNDSFDTYNRTTMALDDVVSTFGSADEMADVVALGDVNGDGLSDMLFRSGNAPHLVFGNTGSSWSTHVFSYFDPSPSGFIAAPGDVNNDGLADIMLGNSNDDAYMILGGALDDVQATITSVSHVASAPYAAGADINSDGASDIALLPVDAVGDAMGMASFGELTIMGPTAHYLGTRANDNSYVIDLHNIPYSVNDFEAMTPLCE